MAVHLAGVTPSGGPATTYGYDAANNLTTITSDQTTTTLSYDSDNQLTQASGGGQTTTFAFDAATGRRIAQGPASDPDQTSFAYNAIGRMTSFTTRAPITEIGSATAADASPASTTVTITPQTATAPGDLILALVCADGQSTTISDANPSHPFALDFDEATPDSSRYAIFHRRSSSAEPASYSFTLSEAQPWSVQLRIFRGVDPAVWEVAPSAATRASATSGSTATAPAITTTSSGALGLLLCLSDASAETTAYSSPSSGYASPHGPSAGPLSRSFTRTLSEPGSAGAASATLSPAEDWLAHQLALKAATTEASYAYDAAGQRTSSTVTADGATTTTTFDYEGLTLLGFASTQGTDSWRLDYLYDEEGRPYGGVYRSPAASASPTFFHTICNDRGDVLELIDRDGAAFGAYRYDEWGNPTGAGSYAIGVWTQSTSLVNSTLASQIASRQLLRYAGYAWDAHSGLYYCSARYYDPASYQWTTKDEVKADGEESAYQYCGGEPIGHVDPSGLRAIKMPKPGKPLNRSYWTSYLLSVCMVNAGYANQVLNQNASAYGALTGWLVTIDWFASSMVGDNDPWDFKASCARKSISVTHDYLPFFSGQLISWEDFGNIHLGYVGRCLGFDKADLCAGSLLYMLRKHGNWQRAKIDNEIRVDWPRVIQGAGLAAKYGCGRTQFSYSRPLTK